MRMNNPSLTLPFVRGGNHESLPLEKGEKQRGY